MCLSMRWYVFFGCIVCAGHMVNTFGMRAVYSVLDDKIYDLSIWQARCDSLPIGNILGIPYLGVYGSPYDFRPKIVLKEPRLLDRAPRAVRDAVADYRVDSYVIIYGGHTRDDHPANMRDTVAIHPVVRKWIANDPHFAYTGGTATEVFQDDTIDLPEYDRKRGLRGFSISVPMGIFDAVNVKEAGVRNHIAVDSLRENQVIFHGNCQFSDNTPFVSYADRGQVATFWLVARSPFSKDALVVFCSVALDESLLGPVWNMSILSVSSVGVSMYRSILEDFLTKKGFTKAHELLFAPTPRETRTRRASPSRGGGAAAPAPARRPESPKHRRPVSPRDDFAATRDEQILQNGALLRIYRDQLRAKPFDILALQHMAEQAREPLANIARLLSSVDTRTGEMVLKNRSDFFDIFRLRAKRFGKELSEFF